MSADAESVRGAGYGKRSDDQANLRNGPSRQEREWLAPGATVS